ncbi:MAG: FkbM family methyltransferase [Selenomonadaceae bacterium]|nr:FkbM family methyltransferase [Selenomonadaceae bacterium]
MDIFMYDHTIDGIPVQHEKFHWSKTGLTGFYDPNHPELETLPRLIQKNGHADDRNMILKMDIEGAEYSVFQTIDDDTLNRFKQIVLEFHDLTNPATENNVAFMTDKLNATHQLVHVHANNYGSYIVRGGAILPSLIEGTYLRRADYKFVKSRRFFPTAIDQPNKAAAPDINLGYWG